MNACPVFGETQIAFMNLYSCFFVEAINRDLTTHYVIYLDRIHHQSL